jgi:hypothetical protein
MWAFIREQVLRVAGESLDLLNLNPPPVVGSEIVHDIVSSLEFVGAEEWPQAYEVRQLSGSVWAVQSTNRNASRYGRYEIRIVFERRIPAYYVIRHARTAPKLGLILEFEDTFTTGIDPKELWITLDIVRQKYGPMPLGVPAK